jgi:3-methylcrotonyl-CoA carboxylase alpha subunit
MSSQSFTKILIANRGEIACRVIQTAQLMGIRCVAVYSDADRHSLHVAMADEAIYIGAAPSKESYLQIDRIIEAALKTGAEAIHPGYGFLSENPVFCRACDKNNIVFIGPPVSAIEAMGSKSAAKNIMSKANVPLVPGYHGEDQDSELLKRASREMGYPVLLKATAGGGGKGMRQVHDEADFDTALAAAKREALNGFGDDTMLVEKYLTQPRHVEIQIFCDQQGNAVYLFERDCSVQRRHQKVIEEAPAPGMTESLRKQMGETAIRAAQAISYVGAGTVEFLLDTDGSFYFMEMNTRLQVEHPVSELISGQDLVEWQLHVAAGEPLPLRQEQLKITGHALEARIYAEDPDNDFLPVTGKVSFLQTPETSKHVRIDTGVREGDEVSVYYDPMIAKLIVWDETRDKALQRLTKALSEYHLGGITTNVNFLYNLASSNAFRAADLDTGFIEKHHAEIYHDQAQDLAMALPLAALYLVLNLHKESADHHCNRSDSNSPWNASNAWRMNEKNLHQYCINLHNQDHQIEIEQIPKRQSNRYLINTSLGSFEARGSLIGAALLAEIGGHQMRTKVFQQEDNYTIYTADNVINFNLVKEDTGDTENQSSDTGLSAPMNGTMVSLLVGINSSVSKDDPLVIMEAMKMEHTIRAPEDGIVKAFYFQPGDLVDGGTILLEFEPIQTPTSST